MDEDKVIEQFANDLRRCEEYTDIGGYYIDHEGTARNLYYEGYRKLGEPRDMIELPCKEHFVYKHDDGHITENWRVFYRAEFALIGTAVFPTEPEADAFLADLKGGER